MSFIASNLKSILKKKDLSAHALEKLAGLKTSAIHNILQGKSKNPTMHTLLAISKALNCSIEQLINHTEIIVGSNHSDLWHGALYASATLLVNKLLHERQLQVTKQEALSFIDEVYLYSLQSQKTEADKDFALWMIEKKWFIG